MRTSTRFHSLRHDGHYDARRNVDASRRVSCAASMVDPFEHLARVVSVLRRHGVRFALIGGQALTSFGRPRATLDIDLLSNDRRILASALWTGEPPAVVRAATDPTDPVDGLVEIADVDLDLDESTQQSQRSVPAVFPTQVVLLCQPWIQGVLERATRLFRLGEVEVPVVEVADFVLLKVYAGGQRDRNDVLMLAEGDDWTAVRTTVDARTSQLPRSAQKRWARWVALLDADDD